MKTRVEIEAAATCLPGAPVPTRDLVAGLGSRLSADLRRAVECLGVRTRHSMLDDYGGFLTAGAPRRFRTTTAGMAATAAHRCLDQWRGNPHDIGLLIAVTNSADRMLPGLGYEVVDALRGRVRSDVLSVNLQSMGCSAFLKAVDLARAHLATDRGKVLVVLSEGLTAFASLQASRYHSFPEVAAMGTGAHREQAAIDTQRLLYAFLFGDGAAAFVLAAPAAGRLGFGRVLHLTNASEGDIDVLNWNEGGGQHPTPRLPPLYWMSPKVPETGVRYVREAMACMEPSETALLHAATFFHVHTGSRKIVERVMAVLAPGDARERIRESLDVLDTCGNMGACSMAFMSARRFAGGASGDGLAVSFGAGFSASVACMGTDAHDKGRAW